MPTYTTPGVYFESVDQSSQGIAAIRTDIAAFIGIAQQGPLHLPTAVNSWEQFQTTFGNFLPNGYMAYCAKAFFENGGQTLYGSASLPQRRSRPPIQRPFSRRMVRRRYCCRWPDSQPERW